MQRRLINLRPSFAAATVMAVFATPSLLAQVLSPAPDAVSPAPAAPEAKAPDPTGTSADKPSAVVERSLEPTPGPAQAVVQPVGTAVSTSALQALLGTNGRLNMTSALLSGARMEPIGLAGWNRAGGVVDVVDGVSIVGSRSELTLGAGPNGRNSIEVYDVAATLDAIRVADVALSLVGGVRVLSQGLPEGPALRTEVMPVLGPSLRWRRGAAETRIMALSDVSGANNDFIEFRIEEVWRLTEHASLSLGYQHQRNLITAGAASGQSRDAFTLELRLAF